MSLRVCVFPEHVCAAGLALTTISKNAINSVLMQGPALEKIMPASTPNMFEFRHCSDSWRLSPIPLPDAATAPDATARQYYCTITSSIGVSTMTRKADVSISQRLLHQYLDICIPKPLYCLNKSSVAEMVVQL